MPTNDIKTLTNDQQKALEIIDKNQFTLLHGVTGSGKTEVYIRSVKKITDRGKQAIVLIPEISLTPQTVSRFKDIFNTVVIHSKITPKQKRERWQQIIDSDVELVIGARSALFAPLKNLGIIVIDEEHDNSYKQDSNPRYNTRDAAIKRAEIENIKVILGSATPDLETFYKFTNNYTYTSLPKRIDNRPLPPITLADMRQELNNKNFSILSKTLRDKIYDRIKKKEKIILFLNRRGYSSSIFCRECGYIFECNRCSVALTYHSDNTARCHYCNHKEQVPEVCPKCHSKYFKYSGIGTQKAETEIQKIFGNAKILRMDSDTTKKRGSHKEILDKFINDDYDILLGTQMIAKGHDFPEVTLVGILLADVSLHIPDFRSAEKTFQLLTQVAGRTGRGSLGGEVIIQTYMPEHYAIQAARTHDYISFYNKELEYRRQLIYPPFSKLILITISSPNQNLAEKRALEISTKFSPESILGPVPALISKLRGFYRWQIMLKDSELDYEDLVAISDVKIELNVDPVNFF